MKKRWTKKKGVAGNYVATPPSADCRIKGAFIFTLRCAPEMHRKKHPSRENRRK